PEHALELIDRDMDAHPERIEALVRLGYDDLDAQRRKYISCLFGGFDGLPDISNSQLLDTEFWPCPQRGQCSEEGKLCNAFLMPSGKYLTKREMEVLRMVATGLIDKEIADRLHMNEKTVKAHNKNIQEKIGTNKRKGDMIRFAYDNKLV
ncbi:MAG: helix-turn-helix transcriptional regulator, partial [Mucilaginibacter polytrichastri]|nr:helix-turn-helix transcriptional regulator [Mucilaginibacter polytrichastri]